jgi:hypothetical protein
VATDCITQVTFRGDGFAKPVVARFDEPQASTDGGLVLLKALDTHLGVTERVAACLCRGEERRRGAGGGGAANGGSVNWVFIPPMRYVTFQGLLWAHGTVLEAPGTLATPSEVRGARASSKSSGRGRFRQQYILQRRPTLWSDPDHIPDF